MKKSFLMMLIAFAVVLSNNARAQYVSDVNGKSYQAKAYTDIEGTPYLSDDWQNGTVKVSGGQVYSNLSLKFDAMAGKLYFKGKSDDMQEFVDPVVEFTINENSTPIHFVTVNNAPTFYQLLADGNVKVLKQPLKEIQETREYGAAASTKRFINIDKYFIVKANLVTPVKKDKKLLLATLGNHQPELETYIKTNNLNLKNDADLGKLVTYYNSL